MRHGEVADGQRDGEVKAGQMRSQEVVADHVKTQEDTGHMRPQFEFIAHYVKLVFRLHVISRFTLHSCILFTHNYHSTKKSTIYKYKALGFGRPQSYDTSGRERKTKRFHLMVTSPDPRSPMHKSTLNPTIRVETKDGLSYMTAPNSPGRLASKVDQPTKPTAEG